ncbi:MAG: CYTH domain-containing protein [Paludibacteraceae bacterium]|nr:CYTH domain-containing protein [Paludibacteraceae bacterium]
MNKNTEIERKFLVKDDSYKALSIRHYEIRQGYLSKEHGRTIRVRIRDNEAFITIKGPSLNGGLSRFEWEKAINVEDAKALLQLALPSEIQKTRWIIPAESIQKSGASEHSDKINNQLFWEVDEFHGRLNGMIIAEIELDNEEQRFVKPDFIGAEVTGNPKYYNSNL